MPKLSLSGCTDLKKIKLKKLYFPFLIFIFTSLNVKAKPVSVCDDSTKLIAYVFLSETCPMSQSYVSVLNNIQEAYKDKGVEIVGVFPNFYTTDSSILVFVKEFSAQFKVQRDSSFVFTNLFNAHITPEIFLVEATHKNILYSGSIDNAYFRAGKRRGKTSANYLIDAIEEVLMNQKIHTQRVEPFGCLIVKD